MTDRIVKFGPAMVAALCSAATVLPLAILSLFVVAPPTIAVKFAGRVLLNDKIVFGEIVKQLSGWRCYGSDVLICRLSWLYHIPKQFSEDPQVWSRFLHLATAPLAAACVAFVVTYIRTPPVETVLVKRGRIIMFDEYARRAIHKWIRAMGGVARSGLWLLPHVQLSRAQEVRNVLLVGTQGAGKTGLLRAYVQQLLERLDLLFLLDVKGDMLAGIPADTFILVAAHDARSWAPHLGRELNSRSTALEFASKCIVASKQDPMWASGARAVMADLALALRARHGDDWSWGELCDLILSSPIQLRQALAGIHAPSATLIAFGDNPEENRTIMSILLTLWVATLARIHPLAQAFSDVPAERQFTVKEWMKGDGSLPRTLIFQKSPDFPELSALLGSFLAERVAAAALSPSRRGGKGPPLAMVLDEFPQVPFDRLGELLSLGRETGVITIGALQGLNQLDGLEGTDRSANIEDRFGIRLVLRLEPGESTDRIVKVWIGERRVSRLRDATVEELKAGITRPRELVEEDTVPTHILTDELGVRDTIDGLVIRLLVTGFPTIGIVDTPLTAWPDRREAHVPAAWLVSQTNPGQGE